jgi:hypothetical protein
MHERGETHQHLPAGKFLHFVEFVLLHFMQHAGGRRCAEEVQKKCRRSAEEVCFFGGLWRGWENDWR